MKKVYADPSLGMGPDVKFDLRTVMIHAISRSQNRMISPQVDGIDEVFE